MKLWLDDIRIPPKGWLWAKDVGEAMQIITAFQKSPFEWEDASFDHDLGNHEAGDAGVLLLWMAEHNYWPNLKPTVHSMNPVGRKNLEAIIDRYGGYD